MGSRVGRYRITLIAWGLPLFWVSPPTGLIFLDFFGLISAARHLGVERSNSCRCQSYPRWARRRSLRCQSYPRRQSLRSQLYPRWARRRSLRCQSYPRRRSVRCQLYRRRQYLLPLQRRHPVLTRQSSGRWLRKAKARIVVLSTCWSPCWGYPSMANHRCLDCSGNRTEMQFFKTS